MGLAICGTSNESTRRWFCPAAVRSPSRASNDLVKACIGVQGLLELVLASSPTIWAPFLEARHLLFRAGAQGKPTGNPTRFEGSPF